MKPFRVTAALGAAVLCFAATACATGGSGPQNALDDAKGLVSTAEATYSGLCGVTPMPGWCLPTDQVAAIEKKIADAEQTAQDAINAGGGINEVQPLITDVLTLLSDFNVNFVHKAQTAKKAQAPTWWQRNTPLG